MTRDCESSLNGIRKNIMNDPWLSVVIPAYNEEETISKTLNDLGVVLDGIKKSYEIMVVDDGSNDNSVEVVKRIKNVKLIQHPYNKGYGAALKTGIKHATSDLILTIDADGTYPAKDAPRLLEHVDEYDMVVGSRTGRNVNIQLYRRPAKWFLSKLANYLSGTKIPDINSGMRIFRREDAKKFFNILPSGFSFTTTMTLAYFSNGYNVKYVPIDYYERKGKSKIKPFRDGFNFIMLMIKVTMYFNPLKIFTPVAVVLFGMGLFFLVRGLMNHNISDLPVMLILTSIQIGVLGLLADLIVKKVRV